MDLALTPDQLAVEELFRGFFAAESPSSLVRRHEALGFAPQLWLRLLETGGPTLAIAAEAGGGGGGMLDAVLMCEAAGFHLAPVPLVEHLVATRLMLRLAQLFNSDNGPVSAALRDALAGHSIATLAIRPSRGGAARLVPAGAIADIVIGRDGEGRLMLEVSAPPSTAIANNAGVAVADRLHGDVATLIASADHSSAHAAFDRAVDEWRLLTSASLVGLADAALRIGVGYVIERHQFGVPIGSFQAIKHGLAEFPGPLSGARLLVQRAAWRIDNGVTDRLPVDAPIALHFATELARTLAARVLHYHGGYGVMAETDIQLYYRRAYGWAAQLADPDEELDVLADRLYGTAAVA